MAKLAYCSGCGREVELNADGNCKAGHPRSSLRNVHDLGDAHLQSVAGSPRNRELPPQFAPKPISGRGSSLVVFLLVVLEVVGLIGVLLAANEVPALMLIGPIFGLYFPVMLALSLMFTIAKADKRGIPIAKATRRTASGSFVVCMSLMLLAKVGVWHWGLQGGPSVSVFVALATYGIFLVHLLAAHVLAVLAASKAFRLRQEMAAAFR